MSIHLQYYFVPFYKHVIYAILITALDLNEYSMSALKKVSEDSHLENVKRRVEKGIKGLEEVQYGLSDLSVYLRFYI